MTPAFEQAARQLLADESGDVGSAKQIADRAVQACEQFAQHLARLLGYTGVQLLLKRSISIASNRVPSLAALPASESLSSALRGAFEQLEPAAITDAFAVVMAAFVGLLERLIGEGLVERLLDEVWPNVFTDAAKDTL